MRKVKRSYDNNHSEKQGEKEKERDAWRSGRGEEKEGGREIGAAEPLLLLLLHIRQQSHFDLYPTGRRAGERKEEERVEKREEVRKKGPVNSKIAFADIGQGKRRDPRERKGGEERSF